MNQARSGRRGGTLADSSAPRRRGCGRHPARYRKHEDPAHSASRQEPVNNGNWQTLTEQYNATAWTIVSSPNPANAYTTLTGVTCSNANDCWAVGATYPNNHGLTLIDQNTGSGWAILGSPNAGYRDDLNGVTCVNAGDCVAVGSYGDSATAPAKTLVAQHGTW